MLEIQVPGQTALQLKYVVSDINGTLSLDGKLLPGVAAAVARLKGQLDFYLLSADTMGTAAEIAKTLGATLHVIQPGHEAKQKAAFVHELGEDSCVTLGQGRNDAKMLKRAAVGICVISREGTAVQTLNAADLVVPDILAAFELLEKPMRLVATFRK